MIITWLLLQVLVHGEQNEMARLKAALIREYEDNEVLCLVLWRKWLPILTTICHSLSSPLQDMQMEIYNPRNTQAVELYFRGEKMAKVMGSLASQKPPDGHKVSGVLIKRGFNYHLIDPSDLSSETRDSQMILHGGRVISSTE